MSIRDSAKLLFWCKSIASLMTSHHTQIRKAAPRDVETILRLTNVGGPDGRPRRELPSVLPTTYMQAFTTIDSDPNHLLMVAEQDQTIVGTFHLTFLTYLAGAGRPDAQIEAIHVSASHRRQGIGTMMLQWAIDEAKRRNCRRVQLTTDKRRGEAHVLYQRLGFIFTHEGAKLNL
jgi:GNAT superfamily N-acetyltransferase